MHNEFARSIRFRHTVGVLLGFGFVACLLEDDGVQCNVLLRMCVGLTPPPPKEALFRCFMLIREKKRGEGTERKKKEEENKKKREEEDESIGKEE